MNNIETLREPSKEVKKPTTEARDQEGTYEKIKEDPGAGNKTVFTTAVGNKKPVAKKDEKKTLKEDPEHVIFAN